MPFGKIGKAFKKVATAPFKAAKSVGEAAIDAGTKVVEGTVAVTEDVYSGTKKTIGAVGRGTSKIGSGLVEGTAGILSDPVSLVGVATGNPGLIVAGQATKRLGGNTFVDPRTGQVAAFDPTGQPYIVQQPMFVPGQAPSQFAPGGNNSRNATNFNNILLFGGLGIGALILFNQLRN